MTDQDVTDDAALFGADQWVYCGQHLAVHRTGWCTVPVRHKVALGIEGVDDAARDQAHEKCKALGLALASAAGRPAPPGAMRFVVTIDEKVWGKYVKRQVRAGVALRSPAEALEALVGQGLMTKDKPPGPGDSDTSTSIMMVLGRVKVEHHP